jgi:ATP adenylyltransferase
MGKLIWHEHARLVSITATIYGIWAGYWALFYRKFFWDFVGGTLRNPGGIQPGPNTAPFISVIVKIPVIQISAMLLGFFILALEWPLPLMKKLPIYRSLVVRILLLFFQAFLTILFYQGTNAAIWSLLAIGSYTRAVTLGETIAEAKGNRGKGGEA